MRNLLKLRPEAEKAAAQIPDIRQLAVQSAYHILHGANPQRKAGPGEAFWQFREYQPGDIPREIDWRQSAKTDRVYIRQSERHTAQTCLFWSKRNEDMGFQSARAPYSKAQSTAVLSLALALLHSRAGEMIGFAGQGRPGHSEKTLQRFEHALVETDASALPVNLNIPKNAAFYAMSDFLEPPEQIAETFSVFSDRTKNAWLVQILDPAEIELPYAGRVLFEDMHADHKTLVNNAVDIRAAYQKRIQDHMLALRNLCAKWGWRYAMHPTDRAFSHTLRTIWLGQRS